MLLVEAVKRREEDKDFWTHYLAWQTMRANGKKKSGKKWKMAFPKFMDFYKRKTEAVANGTKRAASAVYPITCTGERRRR